MNNIKKISLISASVMMLLSSCNNNPPAETFFWNDETKQNIEMILEDSSILPYYSGFISYESDFDTTTGKTIDENKLVIQGTVLDGEESLNEYRNILYNHGDWNVTSETIVLKEDTSINMELISESTSFTIVLVKTIKYTKPVWNEETTTYIANLLSIYPMVVESYIPYYQSIVSYSSTYQKDEVNYFNVVTITSIVEDVNTAVGDYRELVINSNNDFWTFSEIASSDEVAFFEGLSQDNSYCYLECLIDEEGNFVIYVGMQYTNTEGWTTFDIELMDTYIGEGLYIPFLSIPNSYLEILYFEGFEEPMGVSYCSSSEGQEAVELYSSFMRQQDGFIELTSVEDPEGEYYFASLIEENTYFCIDVYLFNDLFNVDGYLYIEQDIPVIDEDVSKDIVLTPNNVPISSGSGYPVDGSLVIDGVSIFFSSVMKGFKDEDAIQMKKSVSYFENDHELPVLKSITIDQIQNGQYTGSLTIYGGTSKDNLNIIEGENGVYDMAGMTYFKIMNSSSYACYLRSVAIDFADF